MGNVYNLFLCHPMLVNPVISVSDVEDFKASIRDMMAFGNSHDEARRMHQKWLKDNWVNLLAKSGFILNNYFLLSSIFAVAKRGHLTPTFKVVACMFLLTMAFIYQIVILCAVGIGKTTNLSEWWRKYLEGVVCTVYIFVAQMGFIFIKHKVGECKEEYFDYFVGRIIVLCRLISRCYQYLKNCCRKRHIEPDPEE